MLDGINGVQELKRLLATFGWQGSDVQDGMGLPMKDFTGNLTGTYADVIVNDPVHGDIGFVVHPDGHITTVMSAYTAHVGLEQVFAEHLIKVKRKEKR